LQVVDVLKAAEVDIVGMVSIFNYGFDIAVKNFDAAGVVLKSLTNYATMIELAIEKGMVSDSDKAALMSWIKDPASWSGI
jgi:orotate phosphoribosyltransferase